jgi:hypothetical protein
VQESQCPQCGEWLGVPPELADRPVRCGACGRVIQPHERGHSAPPPPPPRPSAPRFPHDDDRPADRSPRFPDRTTTADDDRDYDRPRRKGGLWWVWLLLGLGGFGFCCCGGGVVLFFAAANGKWETHTPDNAAFSAEFPNKPTYTTKPFNWKDQGETVGTSHEYAAVQPLQQQGVGVHYADLPKSMKAFRPSDETLLKQGLAEFKADSTNFTVQSETPLTVGKHKAMDIEGTMTDPKLGLLQVSIRVMIVGDRVFTLIAAGKDRKKLQPTRDRFFNSFKPAEPKEETPKEK